MDRTLILSVSAGVTGGVAWGYLWGRLTVWKYRRWWRDARDQLVLSRRANSALAARLASYRRSAMDRLKDDLTAAGVSPTGGWEPVEPSPGWVVNDGEGWLDTPDDQGGATPYPGQGA